MPKQSETQIQTIQNTFTFKVIYVFGIEDESHKDRLKIGDASVSLTDEEAADIAPNDPRLNAAAHKRIQQYTKTADVKYELLWTELAVRYVDGKRRILRDHAVHDVLINSNIKRKTVARDTNSGEWFVVDLATAKNAIKAAKEGRRTLTGSEITNDRPVIVLRPEQREAVQKTKDRFKTKDDMLWDAKMRFGKTVSALTVAKEMGFAHTIIITHRPVVSDGWYEDFNIIFYEEGTDWRFGSKGKYSIDELNELEASGKCGHYVYFASIQDLRGSTAVGGKYDKDYDVFENRWDFVVIDEAHEGTKTNLAQDVLRYLQGEKTKTLYLSGTPFNLYDDFEDQTGVFTWDYVAEQRAKARWNEHHLGETNPYETLPRMSIFIYDLSQQYRDLNPDIEDMAFNFREFFRTYTEEDDIPGSYPADCITKHEKGDRPSVGDFVHEDDVWAFLNLITRSGDESSNQTNYPYSTEEFRGYLRHTLWMVPGVKEARALTSLLRKHPVFEHFNIANVAGPGDEEAVYADALKEVRDAITDKPEENYSITVSCGRLTTGVTVPEWTGVLILSNMSAPATYLQTIFRVQSPAMIDGRMKDNCYAFDFAPDRTLKLVAEASRLRTAAGAHNSTEQKEKVGEFLNYCPIIAVRGSSMSEYDVPQMMRELKRAAAQAAVRNGFDDGSVYRETLFDLTSQDIDLFNKLNGIIGKSKAQNKKKDLVINQQGFDEEQYASALKKKRDKKPLSPEEEAALKAQQERRKQRENAISILRGISIRIPMMIYGADVPIEQSIDPDSFVDIVDDRSWNEFMPKGVTKELFKDFTRFYDADVFIEAGTQIRRKVLAADDLLPEERIQVIGEVFAGFKNPDKETVLTPWRVVNMHLGDCFGGWSFFDDVYEMELDDRDEDGELLLRHIGSISDDDEVLKRTFDNPNTTYLEINSKSGLYPLLCAYNCYRAKVEEYETAHGSISTSVKRGFWYITLSENIFAVCRTDMAVSITKRTLRGFSDELINCICITDPVEKIKNDTFVEELQKAFGKKGEPVVFDVIVGNPPYQDVGGSGGDNDAPVYQHFVELSEELDPEYISLIIPSRWFSGGRQNLIGGFRTRMLNNDSIRKLYDYPDSSEIFPNVEIKGGVCYFLIDKEYHGLCETHLREGLNDLVTERNLGSHETFIRHPMTADIVDKITFESGRVEDIVSSDTPFGIPTNPRDSKKTPFDVFEESAKEHDVELIFNEGNNRAIGYVRFTDLKKNRQDVDKAKVVFPKTGWSGNDPNVLGKPVLMPPHSVCSQTYLYAPFDTEKEAENFIKYYKTRFFRYLVSVLKITQDAMKRVYHYVPMQDFSDESNIDWSKSADEIDSQLFDEYGLTPEQREFILAKIDPMD